VERAPFGGPITVKIGRKRAAIDPDLAELVRVSEEAPVKPRRTPRRSR
jgi:Fe2+ transport system protein FeoA